MRHLRPEPMVLMACRTNSSTSIIEDSAVSRSTAVADTTLPNRRRKLSVSQRFSKEFKDNQEAVYEALNQFVVDLNTRLEALHGYGKDRKHELDAGLSRAYTTLYSVKETLSDAAGDLDLENFRSRASTLVEIVESSYPACKERLPSFDSLEAKAYVCMQLLDGFLGDIEGSAHAVRAAGLQAFDESWKRAEDSLTEGFKSAKEGLKTAKEGLKNARDLVDGSFERAKESLKQNIHYAKQKAREKGLLRYEELPTPWQINPHILKGYRFCESEVDCIHSVFRWTNEFVNIWSHAIGFICVLAVGFYFFPNSVNYLKTTSLDNFFVALFLVAACKCLMCSCMWHTMNSIADQTLLERFACVDYTGISLLIAASIMSTEHIAFYCSPASRWIYVISTGVLGIIGVAVPWHPFFNHNERSWIRVAFFMSLGATGALPVAQLSYMYGWSWVAYFYAPIMKSVTVYVVGAIIYATKVPEKFIPGVFDYFGGSHNIWHFAVLGGIFFHYKAMTEMFPGAFERAASECPALYSLS